MANLGKCMLFCLKYAAEMERLYEAKEPKVEGLLNWDPEKINLVGDTAKREVADFLNTCAQKIEEHFRAISTVRRLRNNQKNAWNLEFEVVPMKATDRRFWIGVYIERSPAALIPWIWCRGSRRAEDEVARILGGRIKPTRLPGWDRGTVVLDEIKIPIPERLEEPVEFDSLVAQVQQVFASFTEQDIAAIGGIASNRGEA